MAEKAAIATLEETLQEVSRKLKEDHGQMPEGAEDFDKATFWRRLLQEVGQCRDDMKQVCLACEKLSPQEHLEQELIDRLKRGCQEVVSAFLELPQSQGMTLRNELAVALGDLFSTLGRFAQEVSLQSFCKDGGALGKHG
ncbi:hypothetical protein V5799_024229 [Amblyomma americanum]|uniref:Uncharacterized protein n=1 Tax=Amblyomma americanum TaxID=6943 RepID=A0AAQ4ECP7_AMBAM